jgi:hypothetical protein
MKVPPLDLQAHQRNARFRAWRGLGVPVLGGWFFTPYISPCWFLQLQCGACGFNPFHPRPGIDLPFGAGTLASGEQIILRRHIRDICPHLAPLLCEEPSTLETLTALELLAGGAA